MKQILQNLKTGSTELVDIPCPRASSGQLLIRTPRSLVSAGTERMLVDFGKANPIEKARQQPDKVRMALYKVKTDGLMPTLETVRNKLEQPLPLGYCNVGRVLEIGVGLGADHQRFAEAGAELWGIDLTERAVEDTRQRPSASGLDSCLSVGDTEALEFDDESFDYVYSWGVLHHSPDTRGAIAEVYRVLRKGGVARVMIYHKWSLVGLMLWVRYGLLGLRPWMTLDQVYGRYLESPGTKAYSRREARELFSRFRRLPESGIPECAVFSFVIKARQQAHSRTMPLLSQRKRRTKRPAGWYVI